MTDPKRSKDEFRSMAPQDPHGAERAALQTQLGLRREPDEEYDAVAEQMLAEFDAMMGEDHAMEVGVNLVQEGCEQYFIGLAKRADLGPITEADRTMTGEMGYCGIVVTERRRPLAINTNDNPRFSTNIVAIEFGVRSYLGEEVCAPNGDVVLTVWVISDVEHEWKQPHLEWIKGWARKVEARVAERAGLTG
jgi:hypothetical protein